MVVAVCTISRQEQKVFTVARPNAVRICPIEETVPSIATFSSQNALLMLQPVEQFWARSGGRRDLRSMELTTPGGEPRAKRAGHATRAVARPRIPLRVLILEGNPQPRSQQLKRAGFELQRDTVDVRDAFIAGAAISDLGRHPLDYALPTWRGADAFHLLQQSESDSPCILVTGTLASRWKGRPPSNLGGGGLERVPTG
jgi:hypothetical protein